MKDRLVAGFLAGVLAGIPMVAIDLVTYYWLRLTPNRLLDFIAILVYGHSPQNAAEAITAQATHFFWLGLLGALFCYLTPAVTS